METEVFKVFVGNDTYIWIFCVLNSNIIMSFHDEGIFRDFMRELGKSNIPDLDVFSIEQFIEKAEGHRVLSVVLDWSQLGITLTPD